MKYFVSIVMCMLLAACGVRPEPVVVVASPKAEVFVLVAAGPQGVTMQEFSKLEKCAEAATYIQVGTLNRTVAECVEK